LEKDNEVVELECKIA